MRCKIKKVEGWPIWHFDFAISYEMASTVLRLDEAKDVPGLKKKRFTLEDYFDWYAKRNDSFDYFDRWGGSCADEKDVKHFIRTFSKCLRPKEKWLLDKIKSLEGWPGLHSKKQYCIIFTCGNDKSYFRHELCHALYYLDKRYARKVREIVKRYDLKSFKKQLLLEGYRLIDAIDEINAYSTSGWLDGRRTKEMARIKQELKKLRREHFNGTIDF